MSSTVRLRLVADNGENVMLTSHPERTLTFETLLNLLRQLHPNGANVSALEYEDDEGDLVTVTNDEEVRGGEPCVVMKPHQWPLKLVDLIMTSPFPLPLVHSGG